MKYKRKNDKNFWVLARTYLHDYMPAVRNLSDKSVDTYKQSLKTYLDFLEDTKSLAKEKVTFDAFSRDNIKEYVTWLNPNSRGYLLTTNTHSATILFTGVTHRQD